LEQRKRTRTNTWYSANMPLNAITFLFACQNVTTRLMEFEKEVEANKKKGINLSKKEYKQGLEDCIADNIQ
jgi:hypothetical protein